MSFNVPKKEQACLANTLSQKFNLWYLVLVIGPDHSQKGKNTDNQRRSTSTAPLNTLQLANVYKDMSYTPPSNRHEVIFPKLTSL